MSSRQRVQCSAGRSGTELPQPATNRGLGLLVNFPTLYGKAERKPKFFEESEVYESEDGAVKFLLPKLSRPPFQIIQLLILKRIDIITLTTISLWFWTDSNTADPR